MKYGDFVKVGFMLTPHTEDPKPGDLISYTPPAERRDGVLDLKSPRYVYKVRKCKDSPKVFLFVEVFFNEATGKWQDSKQWKTKLDKKSWDFPRNLVTKLKKLKVKDVL